MITNPSYERFKKLKMLKDRMERRDGMVRRSCSIRSQPNNATGSGTSIFSGPGPVYYFFRRPEKSGSRDNPVKRFDVKNDKEHRACTDNYRSLFCPECFNKPTGMYSTLFLTLLNALTRFGSNQSFTQIRI